ncbi:MAG: porin family protein [Bacteroidales bacterium]|nr:porin family protein [Bacteroidales bacterium]
MNSMYRLKRIGLLVIGILIFQCVLSQENFKEGYVIKSNSDTIFGLVDHRDWRSNPGAIRFKTKLENEVISYRPADINEFRVEDEIYKSGVIVTEVSPRNLGDLEEGGQLNTKIETAFVQILFKGEKSLYYFISPTGSENFYIKQDTGFELLVYKKYKMHIPRDDKTLILENKKYVGQLILYLGDCPTINSKLENASYNKSSLIKAFQHYYDCTSTAVSFQRKTQKLKFDIGVLAGVSLTSLEFSSGGEFPYLVNADYNSSINISAGLFFDIILPVTKGRWSINNELLFSSYKVEGSYTDFKHADYYSITDTEIGSSYLKLNTLLRYKHPVGKVFLFYNIGMSNGLAISETNYKRRESKFHSTEELVEGLAVEDTRKYERGLIVGAGAKYARFSCEMRVEMGNGMSNYVLLSASAKRYYLLFSYKL